MQPTNPIARLPTLWRGKVMARALFLIVVAALLAAVAAAFGIAHDYGYLHVSILTGSPGGQYHALAMRLSERARREHGTLMVISTAGSIENVSRLASNSALQRYVRPHPGRHAGAERGGARAPGSAPDAGVPAGAWPSRPCLSRPSRFSRGIHRDRPARLRHPHLMRRLLEDSDLRELDIHCRTTATGQARLVARASSTSQPS